MPGILRQGHTPSWGIGIDNLSSKWAASVTLAESFSVNSAYREHEQTNYLGQPCGYMAYYQDLTFDLSATVLYEKDSDSIFRNVSPYILGNETAGELALSDFAMNDSLIPLVDKTIFGGSDGTIDPASFSVVTKSVGTTQSAGSQTQFNASGQIYQWGEIIQPSV